MKERLFFRQIQDHITDLLACVHIGKGLSDLIQRISAVHQWFELTPENQALDDLHAV